MNEHYFATHPAAVDRRHDVRATIWLHEFVFTTASGVFAREGLDKATKILLDESAPPVGRQSVLDLGCGWGPIACAVAVANPDATVFATDTNARALELTRINADGAGVAGRVTACLPDGVPLDVTFDSIWSNPPIRIGKEALHELLLRWLPRLKSGGTARLVVSKNLGADSLQTWLNDEGWPTARETSVKGFRLLVVTAP